LHSQNNSFHLGYHGHATCSLKSPHEQCLLLFFVSTNLSVQAKVGKLAVGAIHGNQAESLVEKVKASAESGGQIMTL